MTCGNKKRILFVMQSLYDGGAEKLLVDMLNNFDYSKYDIDLLLEHDFGNYANLVPLEVRKIILFYNINIRGKNSKICKSNRTGSRVLEMVGNRNYSRCYCRTWLFRNETKGHN